MLARRVIAIGVALRNEGHDAAAIDDERVIAQRSCGLDREDVPGVEAKVDGSHREELDRPPLCRGDVETLC